MRFRIFIWCACECEPTFVSHSANCFRVASCRRRCRFAYIRFYLYRYIFLHFTFAVSVCYKNCSFYRSFAAACVSACWCGDLIAQHASQNCDSTAHAAILFHDLCERLHVNVLIDCFSLRFSCCTHKHWRTFFG